MDKLAFDFLPLALRNAVWLEATRIVKEWDTKACSGLAHFRKPRPQQIASRMWLIRSIAISLAKNEAALFRLRLEGFVESLPR